MVSDRWRKRLRQTIVFRVCSFQPEASSRLDLDLEFERTRESQRNIGPCALSESTRTGQFG